MATPERIQVKHGDAVDVGDSQHEARSWLRRSMVWERRLAELRDDHHGTVTLSGRRADRPAPLRGRRAAA